MGLLQAYANLCHSAVGKFVREDWLVDLKKPFESTAMPIVFAEYLSMLVVSTIGAALLGLTLPPVNMLLRLIIAGLCGLLTFLLFYMYPLEKADSRRKKLDAELPLALNYMASVMGSGAPPLMAFKMVSGFKEYDELSKEMLMIYRRATSGGKSLPVALDEVADKTPSKQLQDILKSLKTEIISGGNITRFFEQRADDRREHYARVQKEYQRSSDTLSEIYLIIALVVPMLFVTMVGVFHFISGTQATQLMTLPITSAFAFDLLSLGVFVGVPFLNIIFIIIVKTTQPEVV
jgi:flagellar protein FlaJ